MNKDLTFSVYPSLLIFYGRDWCCRKLEYGKEGYHYLPQYSMKYGIKVPGTDLFFLPVEDYYALTDSEGKVVCRTEIPTEKVDCCGLVCYPSQGPVHLLIDLVTEIRLYEVDTRKKVLTFLRNLPVYTYTAIPKLGFVTLAEGGFLTLWKFAGEEYNTRTLIPPWNLEKQCRGGSLSDLIPNKDFTKYWDPVSYEVITPPEEGILFSHDLVLTSGNNTFHVCRRKKEGKWEPVATVNEPLRYAEFEAGCLLVENEFKTLVMLPRGEGYEVVFELYKEVEDLKSFYSLPPNKEHVEGRIRYLGEVVNLPKNLLELVVGFC